MYKHYIKVSEITGYDVDIVEKVIKDHWKAIRILMAKGDKHIILLRGFIRFKIRKDVINKACYQLIEKLRIKKTEKNVERFRKLWKLRRQVVDYNNNVSKKGITRK